jgi:hypothetical protein
MTIRSNKQNGVLVFETSYQFPQDKEAASLRRIPDLYDADITTLIKKYGEYGPSWKAEGGHSAFFNLKRKWDRIYNQSKKQGWDLFAAFHADPSPQGIIDDIGDLRRYLALVEAELMEQVESGTMDDEVRLVPRFRSFGRECLERGLFYDTPDHELPDDMFQLKYQDRDILRNITPGTNEFKDVRQKVMLELAK